MMAPRKPTTETADSQPTATFLSTLDHPHMAGVFRLREIILGLDRRVREEIKWNAPSFKIDDHFATFKLHPPKHIQLVLHTGAKAKSNTQTFVIDDPDGLLKWPASDRCVLTLASTADLASHEAAVVRILKQWIAQL